MDGAPKRDAKRVRVLWPESEEMEFTVGPALFGPDLGENEFQVEQHGGCLVAGLALPSHWKPFCYNPCSRRARNEASLVAIL